MSLIICDLDGTLFNNEHRKDLLPTGDGQTTEQWEQFNKACINDKLIGGTYNILQTFINMSGKQNTVFVTGRAEHARKETEQSLLGAGIFGHKIVMRSNSDHRKATEFKREVFHKLGVCETTIVLEDDPSIVEMVHNEFGATVIFVPSTCEAVLSKMSQQGCDDTITVKDEDKREGGLVDGLLNGAGATKLGRAGDKPQGNGVARPKVEGGGEVETSGVDKAPAGSTKG